MSRSIPAIHPVTWSNHAKGRRHPLRISEDQSSRLLRKLALQNKLRPEGKGRARFIRVFMIGRIAQCAIRNRAIKLHFNATLRGNVQQHSTDLDLSERQIADLASPDAIAGLLATLGYQTDGRTVLTPEAVGLSGESSNLIKRIELLSQDAEEFLRVVFAQPKSLTAKVRNDLVRALGRSNIDHVLILASDFDTLEFVFLDKRKRETKGPVAMERIQVVPRRLPRA